MGSDAPVSYGRDRLLDGVIVSPGLEFSGAPLETNTGAAILNTCRVNPDWPCNRPSGLTIEQMYGQLDGLTNIPEDED